MPATGAQQVIAEADGSMVCTVAGGPRNSKKPREWKEIRLTVAQGSGSAEKFYAATFDEVAEVGRRWGHCARRAGGPKGPAYLALSRIYMIAQLLRERPNDSKNLLGAHQPGLASPDGRIARARDCIDAAESPDHHGVCTPE